MIFTVRGQLPAFDFYDITDGAIWFDLHAGEPGESRWTLTLIAL